jgi:hypothetical protein
MWLEQSSGQQEFASASGWSQLPVFDNGKKTVDFGN